MTNTDTIYHIVKKNVDGAYLLDKRNTALLSTCDFSLAESSFNDLILTKSKNEVYTFFSEVRGKRYLQIILER